MVFEMTDTISRDADDAAMGALAIPADGIEGFPFTIAVTETSTEINIGVPGTKFSGDLHSDENNHDAYFLHTGPGSSLSLK